MVHQRQRLPLGLEPGDDLLGVHAQLDDLERDPAADRLLLLGHVDHAAAAFADLLQQLVAADPVAGLLAGRHRDGDGGAPAAAVLPAAAPSACARFQQGPDALFERRIATAGGLDVVGPLLRGQLERAFSDGLLRVDSVRSWHGTIR